MAQRVGRVIPLLFHDRVGEWSAARPGRTLPSGKTRYPLYRRLGGPQGRSGRAEKSRPHRDSIPDRPARSQSLYRLSYRARNTSSPIVKLCDAGTLIELKCSYMTSNICTVRTHKYDIIQQTGTRTIRDRR